MHKYLYTVLQSDIWKYKYYKRGQEYAIVF